MKPLLRGLLVPVIAGGIALGGSACDERRDPELISPAPGAERLAPHATQALPSVSPDTGGEAAVGEPQRRTTVTTATAAPAATVPSTRGAADCAAAWNAASDAVARKDYGAFVAVVEPAKVRDTSSSVMVDANFAIAGHALATSGAPGSVDALAAILNRHGGMLTMDERLAGLTFEEMGDHTYRRVQPHVEAFFADLLAWADAAGYPGDVAAAIEGAPAPGDRMMMIPVDPKKGLIDSIADAKLPADAKKTAAAPAKAPESASSLAPLFKQLAEWKAHRRKPSCELNGNRFFVKAPANR